MPEKARLAMLDRDGTIIVDKDYLAKACNVELIPGAASAIRYLATLGYKVVVTTNQSGIGRDRFEEKDMHDVHARLRELLAEHDAFIDEIYYCPHKPEDNCNCRKPLTGMAEAAREKFDADLAKSFVVGDKCSDVGLGQNAGALGILVRTGYGKGTEEKGTCKPDYIIDSLADIASIIKE